ncbi:hypothetical protein TWF694_010679 [Orbilia ellipsospora]|uniref:Extradiol ring-cleavage dioxygenase class III enzyme subunit B domain-containing protein n=1 Tax=Orbilia ellipsospora TaxID=2528407 RepID=A0AAV9X6Q3_9PEZI
MSPVYFISHGGPPIVEWIHHPAHESFCNLGREILALKPKGIVAVSAHFIGGKDEIHINNAESTDLIYDFYGFPKHYYQKKFDHRGSESLAGEISNLLSATNIKTRFVKRGLDHGIWIPFSIAFDPEQGRGLDVPIVELSLYASEDPLKHISLGKALAPLRDAGYVIVTSGQTVHNLRDLDFADSKPLGYVKSFDKALESALTTNTGDSREAKMQELLERPDARGAHPTFDHILPVYVAIGAASKAQGKQIFNHYEKSIGWAHYRLD